MTYEALDAPLFQSYTTVYGYPDNCISVPPSLNRTGELRRHAVTLNLCSRVIRTPTFRKMSGPTVVQASGSQYQDLANASKCSKIIHQSINPGFSFKIDKTKYFALLILFASLFLP
ncbi:hypothetical protein ABKN59_001564 [Abortiporus biennis]